MPYQPRASLVNPYGPQVTFRTEDVLPPTAVYVSMQDTIVAQFRCNLPGENFQLTLRLLMPDGTMQTETYTAVERAAVPQLYYVVIPPVEAYLLSAVAMRRSFAVASAFCTTSVFRGDVPLPVTALPSSGGLLLMQGYLSYNSHLGWPNSPLVEVGTGAGILRTIAISTTNGANWSQLVPTFTRWQVLGVSFNFTSSSAAGTRQMSLVVLDASGTSDMRFTVAFSQAPSLTYAYYFYPGAAHSQTTGPPVWNTAPLSTPLLMDGTWSVQSSVQGLNAADSWANATMLVREWCLVGQT